MSNLTPHNTLQTSETSRLIRIQAATRVGAFVLNFSALAICLFLVQSFRTYALNSLTLATSLFLISALLVLNGILFLAWGWAESQKIAAEGRSVSDERTGAFTNRAFEKILAEELRRAGRYHYPVTLCLLALDNFESFGENFGAEKGDFLIRQFSDLLRSTVRFSDTVGRASKDGFLVLLPHTDLVRAQRFLTRSLMETQEKLDASFSAGLTTYRAGENQADFLARLELAFSSAKREGRKQIRALVAGQDAQAVLSF